VSRRNARLYDEVNVHGCPKAEGGARVRVETLVERFGRCVR
jgi:hypothetical protein